MPNVRIVKFKQSLIELRELFIVLLDTIDFSKRSFSGDEKAMIKNINNGLMKLLTYLELMKDEISINQLNNLEDEIGVLNRLVQVNTLIQVWIKNSS
jgi:hypothetical protein